MTVWTETAIARELNGRFYQLQQRALGTFQVVDLNAVVEDEPAPAPVKMVRPGPVAEVKPPLVPKPDGSLRMADIANVVCEVFGVTRLELQSIRRNHRIVDARQVFFWLAKKYTSHSYPLIGSWCDRDHTTVMHAVEKIDTRFRDYLPKIERCLSRLGVTLQQEAA